MSNIKFFPKAVTVFLVVSIFFTACDVPDISKFTEQSSEMTRGIRQGVKDTGNLLETAANNEDLFLSETRTAFAQHSKNYDTAMKPTLETLDALDAYLESLNALAQANKKSAENSKAVVGAVNNLVTSASKLVVFPPTAADGAIPESAIQIATGLLAVAEQFRTAKSFKDRVNKAAEIVEGRYENDRKLCTDNTRVKIEEIGQQLFITLENIQNTERYSNKEKEILKKSALINADRDAYKYGCGVIDLLKFTMKNLQMINTEVSELMQLNFRENNRTTFNLYTGINENNSRIQREITFILKHKNLISQIKQDEFRLLRASGNAANNLKKQIRENKHLVKFNLDSIFIIDGGIKDRLIKKITECDSTDNEQCKGMKEFINCTRCLSNRRNLDSIIDNIDPAEKFHKGNDLIEPILDERAIELFNQNEAYLSERDRIKPDYDKVKNELDEMKASQKKLDKLLRSSIDALGTWTTTHANLRVAVNTDKPLSVAALTAKVKEIWAILEPKETE